MKQKKKLVMMFFAASVIVLLAATAYSQNKVPFIPIVPADDIDDISQHNAVVLGGPCDNSAADNLMGNPEPCEDAVPENKSIAKLYTHSNGNVALLIAGRTAQNTRQGARAVASSGMIDSCFRPFVSSGVFTGELIIITGDNAAGSDVVGAADIAQALQKAAVTSSPPQGQQPTLCPTGDAVEIGSTSDLLELNETEGDVQKELADMLSKLMAEQKFLQRIFGNERINVEIKGAMPFHVITEEGTVIDISEGMLDDPTMNLYSDEDTIRDIISKELTIAEAMEQGRIRYEGVGLIKSIKTGLLKTLVKLFS